MMKRMIGYLYALLSISSMIQSFHIHRHCNSIIQHTHQKQYNHHQSSLSSSSSSMLTKKRYSFQFNYKTFDEFLDSMELPVLVDFYAEWCGPCKMMVPVLEDLATRLDNVAKIAKVDTDKSPRLGNRYQVEALPTLILFNKGQIVERFLGYRTADELETEIKNALKKIQQ